MQDCSSTWYFILNIVEGLSNSTVNRLLRYMIDHEIIYEIRDGRFKRYRVGDRDHIQINEKLSSYIMA